jgi:hypothetical protein
MFLTIIPLNGVAVGIRHYQFIFIISAACFAAAITPSPSLQRELREVSNYSKCSQCGSAMVTFGKIV